MGSAQPGWRHSHSPLPLHLSTLNKCMSGTAYTHLECHRHTSLVSTHSSHPGCLAASSHIRYDHHYVVSRKHGQPDLSHVRARHLRAWQRAPISDCAGTQLISGCSTLTPGNRHSQPSGSARTMAYWLPMAALRRASQACLNATLDSLSCSEPVILTCTCVRGVQGRTSGRTSASDHAKGPNSQQKPSPC
jgi:hypothetical protein